jgi:nitroreductase
VDVYTAIASKRDERRYADRRLSDEHVERILDAGRLAGSSRNTQNWEFVVVEHAQEALADAVYAPENVRTAGLVVAIVGSAFPFDAGRCAQNMMLAAWDQGISSCPNGIRDAEAAAAICGGEVRMILSFGYPEKPRDVAARSAEEWSATANRKPLGELVRRV